MSGANRHIEVKIVGDVTVVQLQIQSVDTLNYETVGQELFALIDNDGCQRILVNMSEVGYLTSNGLGIFVTLHNKAIGGEVRFCELQSLVAEIIATSHLHELIDIGNDERTSLPADQSRPSARLCRPLQPGLPVQHRAETDIRQAAAFGNGWPECQSSGYARNATAVCASEIDE
jgi:anti-sigma B factor antagonist